MKGRRKGNRTRANLYSGITLIIFILLSTCATSYASSKHAVSKWKAPNNSTPPKLIQQWQIEDDALHSYITASVPAVLEHTGSEAFDAHLKGVQSILRFWDAPKHLYDAGLFHSICELYHDHIFDY